MKILYTPLLIGFVAVRLLGASGDYTAHEWGTFTSVQAADGEPLTWNPLHPEELPAFVYSLAWPDGKNGRQVLSLAKNNFLALQRMETPVIYFYADKPLNVNVNVDLPTGTITEWYPKAVKPKPLLDEIFNTPFSKGQISWQNVQILPRTTPAEFLKEPLGSHYYAARETEANPLQVGEKGEKEKFLFYRGIASFQAPLNVRQQDEHGTILMLRNAAKDHLSDLFIYQVRNGMVSWKRLDALKAGESQSITLDGSPVSPTEFESKAIPQLTGALVKAGLFEAEAKAMVKTWNDSWFKEQGTRVLYLLPSGWTDRTLPLKLTPAPRELARVFVGRAELITAEQEFKLLREMIRFAEGAEQTLAVQNADKIGLGRFTEAAIRRIVSRTPATKAFSNNSWELLGALDKLKEQEIKPLAQR